MNVRDSDVMLQRSGGKRVAIVMHQTPTACAGAAASYVLRRIAFCAGAHAPGIDEAIFFELHAATHGRAIEDVERWFTVRSQALDDLGYRLHARRVAWSVPELAAWIASGHGYRGAMLATSYARLHPHRSGAEAGDVIAHAVGLASEGHEAGGDGELVTIDPWSHGNDVWGHAELERAHRDRDRAALLFCWSGWA